MSLTRTFADHLLALAAEGLDARAREAVRALVADGLAVAALGAGEPGPRALAALATDEGGRAASVIGGGRVGCAGAARVNGASMHVLDFEPMWNPANHSVSTTLPALLALAETRPPADDTAGARLMLAFALGIEAQERLRLASRQFEPGELVFHPPGAVGALGSAVACGLYLGLDGGRLAHAIGISASRACGVMANVGSMTKALHCGEAAAAGLEAALLAAQGFTADADALGGPRGYGAAFFGAAFAPEELTRPRPCLNVVEPGPAFKLYPSQYGTHFIITAALEARAALPAGAVPERVRITCPLMPYADRPHPASGLAGKFSFQYTAAAALLDGRVGIDSFTDARRFAPDMVSLLDRITLHPDPSREGRFDRMRVDVAVDCADGTVVTGRCDGPPGIWGRPADPAAIRAKARACLAAALGEAAAEEILHGVDQLEEFDSASVGRLMARMHARPARPEKVA